MITVYVNFLGIALHVLAVQSLLTSILLASDRFAVSISFDAFSFLSIVLEKAGGGRKNVFFLLNLFQMCKGSRSSFFLSGKPVYGFNIFYISQADKVIF